MAVKPAPKNLGAKSRAYWRAIAGTYELDAHELRLLEDICREIDWVERMEEQLAGEELTVRGSQGQPVANPLLQELRQHRAVVKSLMGGLKLPDTDGRQAATTSEKARAAANARWKRAG